MDESIDINNTIKLFQKLVLNTQGKDKKPHNIKIKNNNPNEPKIMEDKRFTAKQKYRFYKTKIEPKLLNKITVDDIDDIVAELKKAFVNKDKDTSVNTSDLPEHENTRTSFGGDISRISDISNEDNVNLTGMVPSRRRQLSVRVHSRGMHEADEGFSNLLGSPIVYSPSESSRRNLIYKMDEETDQKNYSANKIQKVLRGNNVRNQLRKEKSASILQGAIKRLNTEQQAMKSDSATNIQKITRGYLTRRKGEKTKLKNEAIASLLEKPANKPVRRNSFSDLSQATRQSLATGATSMVARRPGRPTNESKGLPTKKLPKKK